MKSCFEMRNDLKNLNCSHQYCKGEFKVNITIEALQSYLFDRYGGWASEQGLFMKLVEEMGEVAEVLNKRAGRKSSGQSDLRNSLVQSWQT